MDEGEKSENFKLHNQYEYMVRELDYFLLDSPGILDELKRYCIDIEEIEKLEFDSLAIQATIKTESARLTRLYARKHSLQAKETAAVLRELYAKAREISKKLHDLRTIDPILHIRFDIIRNKAIRKFNARNNTP